MIQSENEKGRGVVMITHDVDIAKQGKTVFQLKEGELNEITPADSDRTFHKDGNP